MYVNPMGMPMREITTDSVALKASVRSPIWVFRGSTPLADARYKSTVEEQTKKRTKVPREQARIFRLLCELSPSVDKPVLAEVWVVGRYLGKLVLKSAVAS